MQQLEKEVLLELSIPSLSSYPWNWTPFWSGEKLAEQNSVLFNRAQKGSEDANPRSLRKDIKRRKGKPIRNPTFVRFSSF